MTKTLLQERRSVADCSSCNEHSDKHWLRPIVYKLLVASQFVIVVQVIVLLKPPGHALLPSVVQLAGVALGLSAILTMRLNRVRATPALAADAELLVRGPYHLIRHPMYSGLLLFTGSFIISDTSWLSVRLWLSLFVVLLTKIYYEEKELRRAFPEYAAYAARTSRLIPQVW